jgi:hypothetical protein
MRIDRKARNVVFFKGSDESFNNGESELRIYKSE